MPQLANLISAKASTVDPYWTPSETKRWPKQAMAASERGIRADRKQAKARLKASKAEKRDQLTAQRKALGMAG